MKWIAVDDEPNALVVMDKYMSKLSFVDNLGTFSNAVEAIEFVQNNEIDLLFLDINMPDITGIQFMKALKNPPLVIFTTAYTEYALDSYEFDTVDYLLKPIPFDRFLKAVNKARARIEDRPLQTVPLVTPTVPTTNDAVTIKSGTDIHRVKVRDIFYVESEGNYMKFVTRESNLLSLMNMQETLELLPNDKFIRVHRSFILGIQHIKKIDRSHVYLEKGEVPVSNAYRDGLMAMLK